MNNIFPALPTGVPVHFTDDAVDLLKSLVLELLGEVTKDAGMELQAAVAVEVGKARMDPLALRRLYNQLEAVRAERESQEHMKELMEEEQAKAVRKYELKKYEIGVDWGKWEKDVSVRWNNSATAAPAPPDWRIVSVD